MQAIHVTADADTLTRRAAELIDAGRVGAARPLLAAARALAPASPDLILIAVRLAVGGGSLDQALPELDAGIVDWPAHAGLRKCRSDIRRRMGDREGAARDAAEAVIFDPADPAAKSMLGAALLDLGRADDAVTCLTEALAADPGNLDTRETLAAALEKAGDAEGAQHVLTDGIGVCPGSVSLRNAAILLGIRRRDFTQAVHLAEQAHRSGVADACTFGMKGHALSSLGRHTEAGAAYDDALKLGPEDPYVRHLVISSGAMPDSKRAPEGYIRTVFDGYADRFESHLIALGYGIPGAIRTILQAHPAIVAGAHAGPVLDLGCGTGLVGLAIGDLPVGPFTGVDLSPRMLAHARAKQIYDDLHESDIMAALAADKRRWPLIVAADVLCYFGALDQVLERVRASLEPGGWFLFSVEQLVPFHDGTLPGNGEWALQRQGRYVHAHHYVLEAAFAAGFRVLRTDRLPIRQEAGADVPGLLLTLERMRDDG